MDIHLHIPPDLSAALLAQASSHGQAPEDYALEALSRSLQAHHKPTGQHTKALENGGSTLSQTLEKVWKLAPTTPHILDDSRESIYEGRGE